MRLTADYLAISIDPSKQIHTLSLLRYPFRYRRQYVKHIIVQLILAVRPHVDRYYRRNVHDGPVDTGTSSSNVAIILCVTYTPKRMLD